MSEPHPTLPDSTDPHAADPESTDPRAADPESTGPHAGEPRPIELCCLLRARPGAEAAMTAYEDKVLALVPEHGGELVSRAIGDGADGRPHEVHLFRFPDQAAIDAYLADPRRTALAGERERVVESTVLFPVRIA